MVGPEGAKSLGGDLDSLGPDDLYDLLLTQYGLLCAGSEGGSRGAGIRL